MTPIFDVAVIGGGVIGCALLRRLVLGGRSAILLEKEPDILAGASKGNSGILHTGFDATPGTLEATLVPAGYREYLRVAAQLNLPLIKTGAMVLAWSEAELSRLGDVEARAHENGVHDVRRLSRAQVLSREPGLSSHVKGGLLVPGESVIDPWSAPLAYALQAIAHGAEIRRGTEVTGGSHDGTAWTLETPNGQVFARWVVNCAGLYGDIVQGRLAGTSPFEIRPRKGQFVVFDKAAAELLGTTILSVPSERTKGIVLARTAFGNLLVGPTAEEQDDRRNAKVDSATLAQLIRQAVEILPGLEGIEVTATYAGLRPATRSKDYQISCDRNAALVVVGGIRSTGLTSALGVANHVADLLDVGAERDAGLRDTPAIPHLAEDEDRDWAHPGAGEIVCHCEFVTRREIEAALSGPLPAGDAGGLKRRTRAGMGRCQGFYCNGRIASLSAGKLAVPLAVGSAR